MVSECRLHRLLASQAVAPLRLSLCSGRELDKDWNPSAQDRGQNGATVSMRHSVGNVLIADRVEASEMRHAVSALMPLSGQPQLTRAFVAAAQPATCLHDPVDEF